MQGYNCFKVAIAGDSLVMHNGQTADPLNKFAKAMKEISSKRKKTDADHAALANIEYRAGLYLNPQQQVIVPSRVIEACIAEGAKKAREGKQALAGLFVDTDLILRYAGGPLSVDELVASEEHRLAVPVRVSTARIVRTRPHFHDWSGEFQCSLNNEVANAAQLRSWIAAAGSFVGLCDWRPRNGRFTITEFAQVQQPMAAAA